MKRLKLLNKQNKSFKMTFIETFAQLLRYEVHRQTDRLQKFPDLNEVLYLMSYFISNRLNKKNLQR